jgi:hypothetical protein
VFYWTKVVVETLWVAVLRVDAVLPENTYCLIFLTFFRSDVNLVSSVIVRIQNHEAHCLRVVTTRVCHDPVTALPAARVCGAAASTRCVSENNQTPAD